LIAGLAALVASSSRPLHAQNTAPLAAGPDGDTAFAQPRLGTRGPNASPVVLPQPLSPSEAARLRRLFQLQASGDIAAATREASSIDQSTPLLRGVMGHVLADRLLSRFTRATQGELQSWLADWADLPDAQAVHALLTIRLPRGEKLPPAPAVEALSSEPAGQAIPVPEETGRRSTPGAQSWGGSDNLGHGPRVGRARPYHRPHCWPGASLRRAIAGRGGADSIYLEP